MNLDEIPDGRTVFIDANILIYARLRMSAESERLLARSSNGKVTGVISTLGAAEFCHRRMMQEAQSLLLTGSNPAKTLAKNPGAVRRLKHYSQDVENIFGIGLQVLSLEAIDFTIALQLQKEHGLLTNDSLNLAIAIRHGISTVASNDGQMDSIQGFEFYQPTDLRRANE
jgi:predicted nucleic acid-binding protein